MNRRIASVAGLAALACVLSAGSARADEIKLKDGSKINGTIVGFEDNSFKVKTSYGFAVVQKDQVVSITVTDAAPKPETDSTKKPEPATAKKSDAEAVKKPEPAAAKTTVAAASGENGKGRARLRTASVSNPDNDDARQHSGAAICSFRRRCCSRVSAHGPCDFVREESRAACASGVGLLDCIGRANFCRSGCAAETRSAGTDARGS
jgi:hypothetical protein